jgi:hypothetical protein
MPRFRSGRPAADDKDALHGLIEPWLEGQYNEILRAVMSGVLIFALAFCNSSFIVTSMRNMDMYLDLSENPTLADAMQGKNAGDQVKLELTMLVKSIDDKGITGAIVPGSVVPDGYEPEEPQDDGPSGAARTAVPPSPNAGPVPPTPVEVAMGIRRKGK